MLATKEIVSYSIAVERCLIAVYGDTTFHELDHCLDVVDVSLASVVVLSSNATLRELCRRRGATFSPMPRSLDFAVVANRSLALAKRRGATFCLLIAGGVQLRAGVIEALLASLRLDDRLSACGPSLVSVDAASGRQTYSQR